MAYSVYDIIMFAVLAAAAGGFLAFLVWQATSRRRRTAEDDDAALIRQVRHQFESAGCMITVSERPVVDFLVHCGRNRFHVKCLTMASALGRATPEGLIDRFRRDSPPGVGAQVPNVYVADFALEAKLRSLAMAERVLMFEVGEIPQILAVLTFTAGDALAFNPTQQALAERLVPVALAISAACAKADDVSGAIAWVKIAIAQQHTAFGPWLRLAQLHIRAGELEAAATSVAQAQRLAPDDPRVQRSLIQLAAARRDVSGALEIARRAAGRFPEDAAFAQQVQTLEAQLARLANRRTA